MLLRHIIAFLLLSSPTAHPGIYIGLYQTTLLTELPLDGYWSLPPSSSPLVMENIQLPTYS